jgi:arsenate reductase-like glutaredoxin family protein
MVEVLEGRLILCITISAETVTAIGTLALALATFALIIQTHLKNDEERRQSKIQKKKKDLQEQEEVYHKFLGLEASTGAMLQYHCRINITKSVAHSEEMTEKLHSAWLLAVIQTSFEAEKELIRFAEHFWEALGLLHTRFESTKENTELISNFGKIQREFIDTFIDKAPPEGLTEKQIEEWAKQIEDNFRSFNQDKLNPVLESIMKYLTNEINKGRRELNQMEETKSWWQV